MILNGFQVTLKILLSKIVLPNCTYLFQVMILFFGKLSEKKQPTSKIEGIREKIAGIIVL